MADNDRWLALTSVIFLGIAEVAGMVFIGIHSIHQTEPSNSFCLLFGGITSVLGGYAGGAVGSRIKQDNPPESK